MISTHVLDISTGVPASGVSIRLSLLEGEQWKEIGTGMTHEDGRLAFDCSRVCGVYRLEFEVEKYFLREKKKSFFTHVPVLFKVEDTQRKFHVPLLLSPFGYSTYRGS